MRAFEYVDATTVEDAARWLAEDESARLIAGGTDLLTQMKAGIVRPARLVNLKTVGGLDRISFDQNGGLVLGALASLDNVANSKAVLEEYPLLARAIRLSASPQVRNLATVGGNLMQGSRCWYYRGQFKCWLKGGHDCYARDGENEKHAIFGRGPCYTVQPSDLATALTCLGAEIHTVGPRGARLVPIRDFLVSPTADCRNLSDAAKGEILVSVTLPPPTENSRGTYLKAMERRVWSFALVSVAARLTVRGGVIQDASLVLGGVAAKPWPADGASAALRRHRLTPSSIRRAADLSVEGAAPLSGNGYKVALAKGLVARALMEIRPPR